MTELVDSVAEVFSKLGFPPDQIAHVKEYIKGAIKIFLVIVKNVLS
jgi:hypothetical protein